MNWGMIAHEIPLERDPDICNGQPLLYGALAASIGAVTVDDFIDRVEAARRR